MFKPQSNVLAKLLCERSLTAKAGNSFHKKASPQMFDMVSNVSLYYILPQRKLSSKLSYLKTKANIWNIYIKTFI